MYKTILNDNIDYRAVPMDTDHIVCHDIAPPLDVITNGSLILICGSSGSGKTSLLVNLISKKGTSQRTVTSNPLEGVFIKLSYVLPPYPH